MRFSVWCSDLFLSVLLPRKIDGRSTLTGRHDKGCAQEMFLGRGRKRGAVATGQANQQARYIGLLHLAGTICRRPAASGRAGSIARAGRRPRLTGLAVRSLRLLLAGHASVLQSLMRAINTFLCLSMVKLMAVLL